MLPKLYKIHRSSLVRLICDKLGVLNHHFDITFDIYSPSKLSSALFKLAIFDVNLWFLPNIILVAHVNVRAIYYGIGRCLLIEKGVRDSYRLRGRQEVVVYQKEPWQVVREVAAFDWQERWEQGKGWGAEINETVFDDWVLDLDVRGFSSSVICHLCSLNWVLWDFYIVALFKHPKAIRRDCLCSWYL